MYAYTDPGICFVSRVYREESIAICYVIFQDRVRGGGGEADTVEVDT